MVIIAAKTISLCDTIKMLIPAKKKKMLLYVKCLALLVLLEMKVND